MSIISVEETFGDNDAERTFIVKSDDPTDSAAAVLADPRIPRIGDAHPHSSAKSVRTPMFPPPAEEQSESKNETLKDAMD